MWTRTHTHIHTHTYTHTHTHTRTHTYVHTYMHIHTHIHTHVHTHTPGHQCRGVHWRAWLCASTAGLVRVQSSQGSWRCLWANARAWGEANESDAGGELHWWVVSCPDMGGCGCVRGWAVLRQTWFNVWCTIAGQHRRNLGRMGSSFLRCLFQRVLHHCGSAQTWHGSN